MQCHGRTPAVISREVDTYYQCEAIGCLEYRIVYCIIWFYKLQVKWGDEVAIRIGVDIQSNPTYRLKPFEYSARETSVINYNEKGR